MYNFVQWQSLRDTVCINLSSLVRITIKWCKLYTILKKELSFFILIFLCLSSNYIYNILSFIIHIYHLHHMSFISYIIYIIYHLLFIFIYLFIYICCFTSFVYLKSNSLCNREKWELYNKIYEIKVCFFRVIWFKINIMSILRTHVWHISTFPNRVSSISEYLNRQKIWIQNRQDQVIKLVILNKFTVLK